MNSASPGTANAATVTPHVKPLREVFSELLTVLPAGSRRFLYTYAIATSCLSLLDVAALSLMALTATAVTSGSPVTIPVVGWTFAGLKGYITMIAVLCSLVIVKSLLNIVFLRIATARFAAHEVAIGQRLLAAYMRSPWERRLGRNSADIVRSVDSAVATTVSGVLMPSMSLFTEIVSTTLILMVLVVAQPVTAAVTITYLGALALLLSRVISRSAVRNGRDNREYSFRTVRVITEAVGALKEITLKGSGSQVEEQVLLNRRHASRARAQAQFLSQVPRFVLEAGLVVGFALIGGVGFMTGGEEGAVLSIALFALAGFRIVPSLTRFQAILSQMNSARSFAEHVLDDIREAEELEAERRALGSHQLAGRMHEIRFEDVSYRYPKAEGEAISNVNLTIPPGARVAFVGSSGAGKSTMVDLLLGLLEPTAGRILIDGIPLQKAVDSWRASIGYVPQEVSLFDASIAQNVALTWDAEAVDRERVVEALKSAQLWETISLRPGGIDAMAGERGMSLSGGQRQRIGIARAVYDNPSVLVMDEATSALDTKTEAAIADAVRAIPDVTVVQVAHRLAAVVDSDIIFYFRDARLQAYGSFDEVVEAVPEFAEQAALAGLGGRRSKAQQQNHLPPVAGQ